MKGYTEDEIEDFLAKIEDVNKKVSKILQFNDSLGKRHSGGQCGRGRVRQVAGRGGEAREDQAGDQGEGAPGVAA